MFFKRIIEKIYYPFTLEAYIKRLQKIAEEEIPEMKYCRWCNKKIFKKDMQQGDFKSKIFCSKRCQRRFAFANHKEEIYAAHRRWRIENPEAYQRSIDSRKELFHILLFNDVFYEVGVKPALHHINDMFIIPIPERTHFFCMIPNREKHRNKTNLIIEKLYQVDLEKLLSGY